MSAHPFRAFRNALRALRHSPVFAFTVVLTLGIGLGLNDAIFTVVDCVLLRPLGYRDADRMVGIETHFDQEQRSIPRVAGGDFLDLLANVHGLEAAAHYQSYHDGVIIRGVAAYLPVAQVSPRFFELLGVQPIAGRLFHPDDEASTEAMVSASFARDHFGGTAAALGQPLRYGGGDHAIVGVLPAGFSFPNRTEVWLGQRARPESVNRSTYNDQVLAKRRAGVSQEQLTAELASFSRQLQRGYVEDAHKSLRAVPLQEQLVGRVAPTLHLLMGAVLVVLLIVCTNLAHLQIVRSTRRLRGVTIRTALGASRANLAAEALAEALLLAAAGTMLAAAFAWPTLKALLRFAPEGMPRLAEVRLNGDVFLFSCAVSAALMALTAVLPILHSWRVDPAAALRNDSSRGMESRGARRLRGALLVTEVAFTLVLSVAAVLLARQLNAEAHTDLGFAADHLLTLDMHMAGTAEMQGMPEAPANATETQKAAVLAADARIAQVWEAKLAAVLEAVRRTPGVTAADAIVGAPMGYGGSDVSYAIRGRQVFRAGVVLPDADVHPVTPALFLTMGVPLLQGRAFGIEDRLFAPSVLLINAEMARQEFPGQNPIGQQIMCGYDWDSSWWTIVGVVGDMHTRAPGAPVTPTIYVPLAQHPEKATDLQLVARTAGEPTVLQDALSRKLGAGFPDLAIQGSTMTANIAGTQRMEHLRSMLFGGFAAVSLLLAALGMYGVTAYSVAQRRFEFGLRAAVGATRSQLLSLALRRSLGFAAAGVGIGVVLALLLTRVLGSVMGGLPAADGVAYVVAALAVLTLTATAALLPAARAAGVEPVQVLRYE